MVRAPCCEKIGLKKGSWTAEEDMILMLHIQRYGHANWRSLPRQAGNWFLLACLLISSIDHQFNCLLS